MINNPSCMQTYVTASWVSCLGFHSTFSTIRLKNIMTFFNAISSVVLLFKVYICICILSRTIMLTL